MCSKTSYRLPVVLLVVFGLLLIPMTAAAQGEPPAPQFLFRDGNHLVLLNGYTGERTELPFEITERDSFEWSPGGQYVLAQLQEGENSNTYCLNLYDVDEQAWAYDQPISCAVEGEPLFSADSTRLLYTTTDNLNGTLWLYTLADKTREELYQTTDGQEPWSASITIVGWSPTGKYLMFSPYRFTMGGSYNGFVIMNIETHEQAGASAADSYYASYHPIWSADDRWFLLTLKDEYVTSSGTPFTNHQGDVYLVNVETGKYHRLTYTPAVLERDVHWTEDGQIAFTEVIEQEMIFTLEQAINVEVVPQDAIVVPEPINQEDYLYDPLQGVMVSPDDDLGAWVSNHRTEPGCRAWELIIDDVHRRHDSDPKISVPIPESYEYNNVLIGWRPSDYPYPQD